MANSRLDKLVKTMDLFIFVSKCSNLIYTISELIFEAIFVRSEGEFKHIRLNDNPKAAKKKPEIV